MVRTLKRPDGWLVEEWVTSTAHLFEQGELGGYDSGEGGDYTGVFWFQHMDGPETRRYTRKTAPAWLLALYIESTTTGTRR